MSKAKGGKRVARRRDTDGTCIITNLGISSASVVTIRNAVDANMINLIWKIGNCYSIPFMIH